MKKTAFLFLIICFFTESYAQINETSDLYKKIPQENIFVHYNASFLLSGEQLLYKVYCLNSKTKRLTNLSKIAYIELIDSDYKVHFKHKIILDNGTGYGDFFVPSSVKSGNYKIIAYTKWMKNGGENNFFQGSISVLNPFSDNSKFLVSENEFKKDVILKDNLEIKNKENQIKLLLNKLKFTNREKVKLEISSPSVEDFHGDYSISVRKVDGFTTPKKYITNTYQSLFSEDSLLNKVTNKVYIPEFRGELISGKVIDKELKKGIPNINISLSIPGDNYVFKVSKTNSKGIFYFNINKRYNSSNAIIQIDEKNRESYRIIIDNEHSIDYKKIVFDDFNLTENVKTNIIRRSINNQIENAYNQKKQDTLKKNVTANRFFGTNVYTYLLDDYTRFPTLKETLTEITELLYYSKKGEDYTIKILKSDFLFNNLKPLIIVDGLQILDHNEIINLKTINVEKIIVLKDNYSYGANFYNGVIILETFKGDYKRISPSNKLPYQNIKLFKPLVQKEYYIPKYDSGTATRIPDYRSQLFWKQNFKLSKEITLFTFYTSDNIGNYEVNVEGFTINGEPISIKTTFEVN